MVYKWSFEDIGKCFITNYNFKIEKKLEMIAQKDGIKNVLVIYDATGQIEFYWNLILKTYTFIK